MDLQIRAFTDRDIEFALAQTTREGWDNTHATFRVCLRHDPDGCFIADLGGERVGTITTTCYARSAWIGNLIVVPGYRRRGIGEGLVRHAIGRLEAGGMRTFWLEADPMGENMYRRFGFVEHSETPRFTKQPPHRTRRGETRSLHASNLATVCSFDAQFFGDHRGKLLAELLQIARAAYCVRVRGKMEGFALALPSARGVRFGPCVVGNLSAAAALLSTVLADFSSETVIAGVPDAEQVVADLLEAHGFTRGPATLRMVRGDAGTSSNRGGVIAIANGAVG